MMHILEIRKINFAFETRCEFYSGEYTVGRIPWIKADWAKFLIPLETRKGWRHL